MVFSKPAQNGFRNDCERFWQSLFQARHSTGSQDSQGIGQNGMRGSISGSTRFMSAADGALLAVSKCEYKRLPRKRAEMLGAQARFLNYNAFDESHIKHSPGAMGKLFAGHVDA